MTDRILAYPVWLSLPAAVRHKLVVLFDIPKSGNTLVEYRSTGNVITSDGYTPSDLRAITLGRLQHVVNSESPDFYELFEKLVSSLDESIKETYGVEVEPPKEAPAPVEVPPVVAVQSPEPQPEPKQPLNWTEFTKQFKGKGVSMTQVAAYYKEYKENYGKDGHSQA